MLICPSTQIDDRGQSYRRGHVKAEEQQEVAAGVHS